MPVAKRTKSERLASSSAVSMAQVHRALLAGILLYLDLPYWKNERDYGGGFLNRTDLGFDITEVHCDYSIAVGGSAKLKEVIISQR